MSFLRNIGPIFTKHYEKAIVALALLGLVGAVFYLARLREEEEQKIKDFDQQVQKKKGNPIPQVDLAQLSGSVARAKNPPVLDFGRPHNLFNSVKWQKKPDGSWVKLDDPDKSGGAAIKIVSVTPLTNSITLDRATGSQLAMSALQEGSTNAALRRKIAQSLPVGGQHLTKMFTLREIVGTAEKPEAIVELADGRKVTVTLDKPFVEVVGYKAELTYPLEGKNFKDVRVDSKINLSGEDYIIVAITENEVVVSASSNNRRATIRK